MKTTNHRTTMQILHHTTTRLVTLFLIAGAIALAAILLTPSPVPAKPVIAWTPDSVTQTILAGESVTVPVSFTASENLDNVEVRVVPELEPYVQVAPSSFDSITAGQAMNLDTTISAPASALPGMFDGTIQLRSGDGPEKTYAKPLVVTVKVVWQVFKNDELGVSIDISPALVRVDSDESISPLAPGGNETLAIFQSVPAGEPATDAPADGCSIYIGIEDNSAELSLSDWLLTRSYRRLTDVDEAIQIKGISRSLSEN
jgi:hypothetical protein